MRARKAFCAIGLLATFTIVVYYILLSSSYYSAQLEIRKRMLHQTNDIMARAKLEDNRTIRLSKYLSEFIKSKYKHELEVSSPDYAASADSDMPKPYGLEHMPKAVLGNGKPVIPVIVMACNRISVQRCLNNLIKYRQDEEQFPIIVSQDCGDVPTKRVIEKYGSKLTLIEQPDLSDIKVPIKDKKFKGYYKIARHYGWALNTTFKYGYDAVIIVEDDLDIAPDFFEYFRSTYELLKKDQTLWCISAWNDNGRPNCIDPTQSELLYRTDFFPGLGWMLTNRLWHELSVKWPKSFWDDWIRQPEQRKGRACIRPEISRTKTFGKNGTSNGLFYEKYLKHMYLGESFIRFTQLDLRYLRKENYDRAFLKMVFSCPLVQFEELRNNIIAVDGPVRLQYTSRNQYKQITKALELMDDFKSGVPRTAYRGIVSFFHKGRRVHLHPPPKWKGYDPAWS